MGTVWFMAYPKDGSEPFEYGIPIDETIHRATEDMRHFSRIEIVEVDYFL